MPSEPFPERSNQSVANFLKRYDNFWIDSESQIPAIPTLNFSLRELKKKHSFNLEHVSDDYPFEMIDPEYVNPYAIGHKINHPPPSISENVSFIDFDIPYTWFPSEYMRHIPYIDKEEFMFSEEQAIRKDCIRGVAVVAARFIEDGEELYVNYYEDERVPIGVTADWLVKPPPLSPYFEKKRILTHIPFAAKVARKIQYGAMAELFDTWEQRRELEGGHGLNMRNKKLTMSVKDRLKLQATIESKKLTDSDQQKLDK